MQQTILNSLCLLHNKNTDQEKTEFLQSLQPPALELFRAFRTFPVTINYRRQDLQSVYMIRYYPSYSQIIKTVLNTLPKNPARQNTQTLTANFIGCGPSPEIYGLFDFLNSSAFRPQQISINTFDIHSDYWAFSRNITFNSLIPSIWQHCPVNATNNNLNIGSQSSLEPHLSTFDNANLVVLQNCLNEIPEQYHNAVLQNLKKIISRIPSGATILIIDLFGYQPVLDLLAYIEDDADVLAATEITRSSRQGEQTYDAQILVNTIPQTVRQNLLTGIPYRIENGLIPRRYIRYHHLAIRKR